MSKKFDAIKKAVFYSEQRPEMLARILNDSVEDKATSIMISGVSSIRIPTGETSETATYTAKVLSQFGDEMSGSPVLSLKESVTGVSILGETVSVSNEATADGFIIVATSGTLTAELPVALVAAN